MTEQKMYCSIRIDTEIKRSFVVAIPFSNNGTCRSKIFYIEPTADGYFLGGVAVL